MASSSESNDPQDGSGEGSSGGANFEQTLARLEEIVHLLEDGEIGLDEALGRYEEGVGLLRTAYDMLQRAERKISLLTGLDSEGNPVLRPLEDAASFSLEGDAAGRVVASPRRDRFGPRGSRRTNDLDSP
jgi:exodeoxyribonuclease VII small subunit